MNMFDCIVEKLSEFKVGFINIVVSINVEGVGIFIFRIIVNNVEIIRIKILLLFVSMNIRFVNLLLSLVIEILLIMRLVVV